LPITSVTGKHIIIADDYDDSADMLALLLEDSSPHRVTVAKDGEKALRLALAGRPDVVLLDVDMPKMSGSAVALAIRDHYGANRPALIGFSGTDVSAISKSGIFDHVLQKPVGVEDLLRLIDAWNPAL